MAASNSPDTVGVKWALGIAAATLVVGLSAVVVGFARRRSGFLAFLGIIGVIATITTAVIPVDRHFLSVGGTSIIHVQSDGRYVKTVGYTDLNVVALAGGTAPVIDLWQGAGEVQIDLAPGATVRVEATEADGVGPEVLLVRTGSGTIDRAEFSAPARPPTAPRSSRRRSDPAARMPSCGSGWAAARSRSPRTTPMTRQSFRSRPRPMCRRHLDPQPVRRGRTLT